MRSWFRLACSVAVVQRALKYAVVVGALLIFINHGDNLIRGELTQSVVFKMILTVFVPYAVSTLSSVSAMRSMEGKESPA